VKVLHIVKTAVGATWAYEQVRVLTSLGIEVVVALPSADLGLGPAYCRAGAEVVAVNLDFPARRPWKLRAVLAACREVVAKVQPDLIHCHHVGTMLVARLALGGGSKIPRVFQVPGPLHLESAAFANLDLRLAGPPDRWIATCEWTRRKYLEMGVPANRVFLSYAGTDIQQFVPGRTGRLRAGLGVSPEVPLVGMVAYMYAPKWFLGQERGLKGHEDFFAALNLARNERPDIRGVVIGGAWNGAAGYEDRLRYRGHAICDGSLTFLGTRPDVAALYPDLDLAVVPSHSENCGGAVEPLLCGVPVVATNVGGLPDLIRDGETGWLVPPKNPEALARAILDALQDKQEARRRAVEGQKLVRELFDVERTARGVAEIYDEVLVASSSAALTHERLFNQSPERGKRTREFVPIRLSRRRLF
jgi:glycosyltransferase involved in cell wall biosynthesis